MKKLIVSLFLVIGLYLNISARNKTDSTNVSVYRNILESELSLQVEQNDVNASAFVKEVIYNYYAKTSFEEEEWQRVKKFLIFLEENGTRLNTLFNKKYKEYYYDLPFQKKVQLIGAFWGANYLTNTFVNKDFDMGKLDISVNNACEANHDGTICVDADDIISSINVAIHEATHVLPFVVNKGNNLLSEQATIFAQLYLGLPIKPGKVCLVAGTRAWFKNNEEDFIEKYYVDIPLEYSEIIFPVTQYKKYKRDINNCFDWSSNGSMAIAESISYYAYIKVFNEWAQADIKPEQFVNSQLIKNSTFKNIAENVLKEYYRENTTKANTKEELGNTWDQWFLSNYLTIGKIIFKELANSASDSIPPVPKGYI